MDGPNPDNVQVSSTFSSIANAGSIADAFDEATQANRATVTTLNSLTAFGGVNAISNAATGAKSRYRFMHDGTGCTIVLAARASDATATNRGVLANFNSNGSNTGIALLRQGSTGKLTLSVGNGSGALLVGAGANGAWSGTTNPVIVTIRHSTSFGYDLRVDATSATSGSYTGTAATGDATSDFEPMSRAIGSAGFLGEMGEFVAYSGPVLSGDSLTRIENYMASRWGVTLP